MAVHGSSQMIGVERQKKMWWDLLQSPHAGFFTNILNTWMCHSRPSLQTRTTVSLSSKLDKPTRPCLAGSTPFAFIDDHQHHLRTFGIHGCMSNAFHRSHRVHTTLCRRLEHQMFRHIFMLGGQLKIVSSD